jgi:ATP-dependent Lhr-like helicase
MNTSVMSAETSADKPFHAVIRQWFASSMGEPTEVQRLAWPRIASGEHVLAVAPTGSGKTLAAFLWAVDRLLTGAWPGGRTRVLYVSPLKALANDVQRNLLAPLEALRAALTEAGAESPEVRVLVRSGDTPQEERRRMARRPPEILVTTPESLNIILTSQGGRALLGGLHTVILDEVHAVFGSKRGAQLMTSVERLVPLSGEIQRIALSATVRPADRVAAWIGGYDGEVRRSVSIVSSSARKSYEISVLFPPAETVRERDGDSGDGPWPSMVDAIRPVLAANRSTLVFANSRRIVEKLTRLVNESEAEQAVFAHHGSLSREVRQVVEQRLKSGELRGVVATSSLELGIDIGTLDEVLLVQTPPTLASTAQRIGRAGHAVGAASRARFFPLVLRDLLDAAVVAPAVLDGAIEPTAPVSGALDVLAQAIVSIVANETWRLDDLYALLRRADPYHELPRRTFDLVVEMLAGARGRRRMRALDPLVFIDRASGTMRGLPGAARRVYLAGGTIPDRGYYQLRIEGTGALLGELDEEFVWERSMGDSFTLGVSTWRIERVTHNDVFVSPGGRRAAMAPFWRAEERHRRFETMERVASFLESIEPRLRDPRLREELIEKNLLSPSAADALIRFLADQMRATGGMLPHRHRLIIERSRHEDDEQTILHTLWGGRVNLPYALALSEAWERRRGAAISALHEDDCVVLGGAAGMDVRDLMSLVTPDNFEELLRARLPRSGVFGARFREAAAISLLVPREGFRRRTPLWLARQRSKELMQAVADIDDFPLTLEAWRACCNDVFDLATLRSLLSEIASGRVDLREVESRSPSPFSAHAQWKRTNELMYADDTPPPDVAPRARPDLVREVAFSAHLRPRLSPALCRELARKLQRVHPGYAPRSIEELLSFVEERVVVPIDEWRELLAAFEREQDESALSPDRTDASVVSVRLGGQDAPTCVSLLTSVPRIMTALEIHPNDVEIRGAISGKVLSDARSSLARNAAQAAIEEGEPLTDLIADVLRFYGPVPERFLPDLLALPDSRWRQSLDELVDDQRVIADLLTTDAEATQICDALNLERLLRLSRDAARPEIAPLPLERLPLFLAAWQDLLEPIEGSGGVRASLERLGGYPAPAAVWEEDLLPSRVSDYQTAWLDAVLAEGDIMWLGCGEERLTFVGIEDRVLIEMEALPGEDPATLDRLFPALVGRFTLEDLVAHTRLDSAELTRALWRLAWSGHVTCDGFAPVRQGVAARFRPSAIEPQRSTRTAGRRMRFMRYARTRPFGGSWRRLPPPDRLADPLEEEELARDRARLLLERYGVLFRELTERELPGLAWSRLFRALRLMELSGEIVTGRFFDGVSGLQFALPAAVRRLSDGLDVEGVYAMSAVDPASPCGLGLPEIGDIPRRLPNAHLVYDGPRLIVVSEQGGRHLQIRATPEDGRLGRYLEALRSRLTSGARVRRSIAVETINGEPASRTGYRPAFEELFDVTRDHLALRLMRRF